ncbi:MAG: hypothetical protein ACFFD1_05375 [Candidatus Thorarchaeota archaeon]
MIQQDNKYSDLIKKISHYLFFNHFIAMEQIPSLFDPEISPSDLEGLLNQLQDLYQAIGLNLDIIDFEEKEYLVVTIIKDQTEEEDKNKIESSLYAVLTVIAQMVKIRGNGIPLLELNELFAEYYEEISQLKEKKLIIQDNDLEKGEIIKLSPSGALIASPYVRKLQTYLQT